MSNRSHLLKSRESIAALSVVDLNEDIFVELSSDLSIDPAEIMQNIKFEEPFTIIDEKDDDE